MKCRELRETSPPAEKRFSYQLAKSRHVMRVIILSLLLLIVAPFFSGCATVIMGTTQQVSVSSTPSGATANADGVTALTPCVFTLGRKNVHTIEISKEHYRTMTVVLRPGVSRAGEAVSMGLIGLVPWIVDGISGATKKLSSDRIDVALEPEIVAKGNEEAPREARDQQNPPLAGAHMSHVATLKLTVTPAPEYQLVLNGKTVQKVAALLPVSSEHGTGNGSIAAIFSLPAGEELALEVKAKGYKSVRRTLTLPVAGTQSLAVALEKLRGPEEEQPWTIPELGLEMLPISTGTFILGSPLSELSRDPEEGPQTRVTLTRSYWLGKFEVTQKQWRAVMGNNPAHFQGDELPVESVSWFDAMEFCRRLNEKECSADRLPEGYEYTLPTEAQWEYVCRAGTTGPYADTLDEMAWFFKGMFSKGSSTKTHPVGQKKPNAWGFYDMHGNVWEWCRNWIYLEEGGFYPGGRVIDYTGPSSGSSRVARGGGWYSAARFCRSAERFGNHPDNRNNGLGFRLALCPVP